MFFVFQASPSLANHSKINVGPPHSLLLCCFFGYYSCRFFARAARSHSLIVGKASADVDSARIPLMPLVLLEPRFPIHSLPAWLRAERPDRASLAAKRFEVLPRRVTRARQEVLAAVRRRIRVPASTPATPNGGAAHGRGLRTGSVLFRRKRRRFGGGYHAYSSDEPEKVRACAEAAQKVEESLLRASESLEECVVGAASCQYCRHPMVMMHRQYAVAGCQPWCTSLAIAIALRPIRFDELVRKNHGIIAVVGRMP